MDEFYERMSEVGSKLGLSGQKLIDFVEDKYEQQKAVDERETRLRERNLEKEIGEQALEMERLKLSAAKGVTTSSHSHTDIRAKVPKLPPFDDSQENIEDYLQRFERYAVSVGWNPGDRALHLSALLKGKALAVYSRLSPEQAKDYDTLKEALYKRFQLSEEAFRKKFRSSVPENGETPTQFAARIEHYLLRWIELGKVDVTFKGMLDLIVREQFLNSCGENLRVFLREKKLANVAEVLEQAERYVEAHGHGEFRGKWVDKPESRESSPNSYKQGCFRCGQTDHQIRDCKLVKHKAAALLDDDSNDTGYGRGEYQSSSRGSYKGRYRGKSRGSHRGVGQSNRGDSNGRDDREADLVGCCVSTDDNCLPLLSAVCAPPIQDVTKFNRMPTAEGYIGEVKVTVLRDTGCSGVVVRRDLVATDQLTGDYQKCVLVDGTVRKFPKASIEVKSPFFCGRTEALCVGMPIYPLIIGNIPGVSKNVAHADPDIGKDTKDTSKVGSNKVSEPARVAESKTGNGTDTGHGTVPEKRTSEPGEAPQEKPQSAKKKKGKSRSMGESSPIPGVNRDELVGAQDCDETLECLWGLAESGETRPSGKYNLSWFEVDKGLLFRRFQTPKHDKGKAFRQFVVPRAYREMVMRRVHESLQSGHLGYEISLGKVLKEFYWPGIFSDLKRFCRSCEVCKSITTKG